MKEGGVVEHGGTQNVNAHRILFIKPGKKGKDEKPRCKLKGNVRKCGVSGPVRRVDGPEVPVK
jgi:hypothetical protein